MEDETWLMQQSGAWRDGQQAGPDDAALIAQLRARHRRDAWQRRAAHIAVSAGAIFLGAFAAPRVWLRGQHVIAVVALLYIPLIAYAVVRMEQSWRAKLAALARPPEQVMRALGEQLEAREREARWGQHFIKIAVAFTLVLGAAVAWYVPKPVTLIALVTALLIYAVVAYLLHVRGPRELAEERARYESLVSDLSFDKTTD